MKLFLLTGLAALLPALSQAQALPDAESTEFCQVAQQVLANTEVATENTIFTNMDAYRKSKPSPKPLMIYQVVSYEGTMPVMVSCKVKAADHIRSVYGEDAAGEQQSCPVLAAMIRNQAVLELGREGNAEAAEQLRAYVLEQNEPYTTGSSYLADFELSFVGDDGAVHINSPGLQNDYESLWAYIMPEKFIGQTYCHLATTQYLKALATGEMEPGLVMTTGDDAQVTPAEM